MECFFFSFGAAAETWESKYMWRNATRQCNRVLLRGTGGEATGKM